MSVLAVDLAAKYSAACLMSDDYQVLQQFDSWGIDEDIFVALISDFWKRPLADHELPAAVVVEDLPHGLKYSTLIKTVCRLQGRIYHDLELVGSAGDRVLFLAPNTWRAHYEGMERGTGPEAVVPVAARFGYTPPDFTARAKGNGGIGRARKVATDYCAAYLIARWAIDIKHEHGTYDVPGTSRYDTNVIRKKDFDDQNR